MITRFAALIIGVLAFSAAHADEIVFPAGEPPVVAVTINGKPARLLVDTFLPDMMVLNPETRGRLGVRPIPAVAARAVFDDANVRARIARPRIVFANGKSSRAFAGLFGARWSAMAGVDGAVGPGVLPYDRVRIILRDGSGGAMRTHRLADPEVRTFESTLAGAPARVTFRPLMTESMLNRRAARHLDEQKLLTLAGEVRHQEFFLGLSTTVQPATTDERIGGYAIGSVIARTDAPLAGSEDVDVVRATADADAESPRAVTLGRNALAACYEMVWDKAAATLSLRCD